MIEFSAQNTFVLDNKEDIESWIVGVINSYEYTLGDLSYLFCDDEYLLGINQEFLKHDTYTDIITFDYSYGKTLSAELLISTQRVKDNAKAFKTSFSEELHRVMIHGVLHCLGFKDKTELETEAMREAENNALQLLENQLNT